MRAGRCARLRCCGALIGCWQSGDTFPRDLGSSYQWRGLMVDTARHYIPVGTIKRIIDGMEQLKLSVFHWYAEGGKSTPRHTHARPHAQGRAEGGRVLYRCTTTAILLPPPTIAALVGFWELQRRIIFHPGDESRIVLPTATHVSNPLAPHVPLVLLPSLCACFVLVFGLAL